MRNFESKNEMNYRGLFQSMMYCFIMLGMTTSSSMLHGLLDMKGIIATSKEFGAANMVMSCFPLFVDSHA